MNLGDYARIIRRRGWILVLAVIITTASAFVFSKLQTPLYRSTQKILVEPARPDFGLTQAMIDLLNSYVEWMSTSTLAQQVIDQLKLDVTPSEMLQAAKVTVEANNHLLDVDVDMTDGNIANDVARTYGVLFQQWRDQQNQPLQLTDRINAELLDTPSYALIRPTTSTNVLAGALLGLIVGGALIFVIETLSANVVHRAADVERALELPVLGVIPDSAARSAS